MTGDVYSLSAPQREPGPLEGVGIVVTRPQRQAAVLAAKIGSLGGVPIILPAIVILPPPDREPLERAHAALRDYDIAVFVSANAVEFGAPAPNRWPAHIVTYRTRPGHRRSACRGRHSGCARTRDVATTAKGCLRIACARRCDGQAHRRFSAAKAGANFWAIRCARAARIVDHVPCYRRVAPQSGADGLVEALRDGRGARGDPHVERRARQPVAHSVRPAASSCRALPAFAAAPAHRRARARARLARRRDRGRRRGAHRRLARMVRRTRNAARTHRTILP